MVFLFNGMSIFPMPCSSLLVRCFHAKRSCALGPSHFFDSRIKAVTACLWLCTTCRWLDISVRTVTTDNSFTDILIARQKHEVVAAHERIA